MCYSFSPCTDFFWLRGIKIVVVVVVVATWAAVRPSESIPGSVAQPAK